MKGTTAGIFLIALAVVGGCAHPSPTATPTSPPPNSPPRSAAHTTEARPVAAPATSPWGTGPITVTHTPKVPPVPVITGIRYAGHQDGFDRLVLDIPGALPGYSAKYVKEVRRDGSGEKVSMPG